MQIKKANMIEESDFSKLVQSTYGKPYRFQQQDGCMDINEYLKLKYCIGKLTFKSNEN